ncbi:MAG: LTA synthase family protein [Lachnospiraceae bacterium]|nr:LTA synthase family protein [Lachnospiraceae bacterium]
MKWFLCIIVSGLVETIMVYAPFHSYFFGKLSTSITNKIILLLELFVFILLVMILHSYVCYDLSFKRENTDRLLLRIVLLTASFFLFLLEWKQYIASFYDLNATETYEGSRLALKIGFILFISLLPLTDYRKIVSFLKDKDWISGLQNSSIVQKVQRFLMSVRSKILLHISFLPIIDTGIAEVCKGLVFVCKGIYQIYLGLIELIIRLKGIASGIVVSSVIFIMMEYYTDNEFYMIDPRRIYWNIVLYCMVYLIVWVVLRSVKWTSFTMIIFFTVFGMVNYFTILFRGNPVSLGDFTLIRTALSVAGKFEYRVDGKYIIATCISVILLIIIIYMKRPMESHKKKKFTLYFISIGIMVIMLELVGNIAVRKQFFYNLMYHEEWNTKLQANYNGYFLAFIGDSSKHILNSPDNYDLQTIDDYMASVESEYDPDAVDLGVDRDRFQAKPGRTDEVKEPNIIVIMSESFADLSILGDLETDVDYMPYIRSLTEDTIYGNLYVSPYGGNTVYSEFEFLTGDSMAMFPSGSIPYTQYMNTTIETPSLVSTLEHQDTPYQTVAIHPYAKSGYHRVDVYSSYGFDRFITIEEFPEVKIWRKFMQDEDNYKKLIEVFEEKDTDQPMFIFNITMQNHGGYGERLDYQYQHPVQVTNYDTISAVDEYLSGIKDSDVALEDLLEYFSNQEEPVVLLFFGDHQPMLPDEFYENMYDKELDELDFEDSLKKFIVPFFIWSNYEDYGGQEINAISTNYLAAILMELSGLNETSYQKFLLKLHEKYPVTNLIVNLDQEGNRITKEEIDTRELYYMYEMIEYNSIIEKGNERLNRYLYPLDDSSDEENTE